MPLHVGNQRQDTCDLGANPALTVERQALRNPADLATGFALFCHEFRSIWYLMPLMFGILAVRDNGEHLLRIRYL